MEFLEGLLSDISQEQEFVRLHRVMTKEPIFPGNFIKRPAGEFIVSPFETLEGLLDSHFPSCV